MSSDLFTRGIDIQSVNCLGDDSRVLTDKGFLFLDEVRACVQLAVDGVTVISSSVRIACYNELEKRLEYHPPSQFILKPHGPHRMVEFSQEKERRSWSTAADQYGRYEGKVDKRERTNRVSMLVTAAHDMFVQQGRHGAGTNVYWPQKHGQQAPPQKVEAQLLLVGLQRSVASASQQRFYLEEQRTRTADASAYAVPIGPFRLACSSSSEVDETLRRVEAACRALVERHAGLRTALFVDAESGALHQRVLPMAEWRAVSAERGDVPAELHVLDTRPAQVQAELRRPLDLGAGSVLRVRCVQARSEVESGACTLTVHLVTCRTCVDGRSVGLVERDMRALLQGVALPLSDAPRAVIRFVALAAAGVHTARCTAAEDAVCEEAPEEKKVEEAVASDGDDEDDDEDDIDEREELASLTAKEVETRWGEARGLLPFVDALGLQTLEHVHLFLELYGFWLGDGSMYYTSRGARQGAVEFAQRKTTDIAWLLRVIPQLGVRDMRTFVMASTEMTHIRIHDQRWFELFDDEYGRRYVYSALYQAPGARASLHASASSSSPASITRSLSSASPSSVESESPVSFDDFVHIGTRTRSASAASSARRGSADSAFSVCSVGLFDTTPSSVRTPAAPQVDEDDTCAECEALCDDVYCDSCMGWKRERMQEEMQVVHDSSGPDEDDDTPPLELPSPPAIDVPSDDEKAPPPPALPLPAPVAVLVPRRTKSAKWSAQLTPM